MKRLALQIGLSVLSFVALAAPGSDISSKGELTAFVDGVVESGLDQNDVAGAVVATPMSISRRGRGSRPQISRAKVRPASGKIVTRGGA